MLELRQAEHQTAQKHRAMQDWGKTVLELHSQLVKQIEPKANDFDDEDFGSSSMWGGGFRGF